MARRRQSVATNVSEGSYEAEVEETEARSVIRESPTTGRRRKKDDNPNRYTGPPIKLGTYGPYPREEMMGRWIEEHDKGTEVQYIGRDNKKYPDGCWKIEAKGYEVQYVGPKGLAYIAQDVLGMPKESAADGK